VPREKVLKQKKVVMNDGKIQQIGPPLHLYNHPANKFVAGFLGSPPMNFFQTSADAGF
jgi:multiple sugar transport system ATP-binding protein